VAARIVVTGAQGFLGRNLVRSLLDADPGARVLGIGRSPRHAEDFTHRLEWAGESVAAPLPADLRAAEEDPRHDYQPVDLGDASAVAGILRAFQPGIVVHAAAALRDEPLPALLASNLAALAALLESIPRSDEPPRVVLVSSGSVYGGVPPERLPIVEDEQCRPLDLYAATKRAAEDVARILAAQLGLPLVLVRVFNLLGPGLQDRHLAAALARQVAAIKLGLSPPVLEVGPLDTTRDFVDVRDAASGVALVAETGVAGTTYNLASGRETPVQEILDGLLEAAGLRDTVSIARLQRRAGDYERSYADIGRIRSLGFEPTLDVARSLGAMLDYYTELVRLRSRS
jgi:GDP-4-dehydro-6-deoxy-D-mannose reductase